MNLNLQGIDLEKTQGTFPSENGEIVVQVSDVIELKGSYSRVGRETLLRAMEAKRLRVTLGLPLSGGGLSISSPATLLGARADLRFPFSGHIAADILDANQATLSLAKLRLDFALQAEEVSFVRTPEKKTTILAKKLIVRNARLTMQGTEIQLGSIEAKEVSVSFGAGPLQVRLASAQLTDSAVQNPKLHVNADTLELLEGFSLVGDEITLGKLAAGQVSFTMQLAPQQGTSAKTNGNGAKTNGGAHPNGNGVRGIPIDLKLLDGIFGHANVDAILHAKVPVIAHRRATHRFRIPIEEGTLNYKKLEKNLAGLEDAFIDIEVNQGRLAVQRDIPLIPDIPKPIVLWDLDAKELELAKKQLVRLRTLPRAYLAPSDEKKDKEKGSGSVALEYLALRDIDVELELKPPQQPVQGAIETASIHSISANGSIQYKPGEELPATAVEVSADEIALSLKELPIGERDISVQSLSLHQIEKGLVSFVGVKPQEVRGLLHGTVLTGVAVRHHGQA